MSSFLVVGQWSILLGQSHVPAESPPESVGEAPQTDVAERDEPRVIQLSEVSVSEKRKLRRFEQQWRFTVLDEVRFTTSCSETVAREIARWLVQFRDVLDTVFQLERQFSGKDLDLIVCEDRYEFDRFLRGTEFSGASECASVVLSDQYGVVAIIDASYNPTNLQRRILRSYTLAVLRSYELHVLPALEEGISRTLAYAEFEENRAKLGKLNFRREQQSVMRNEEGRKLLTYTLVDELTDFFRYRPCPTLSEVMALEVDAPQFVYSVNSPQAVYAMAFTHLCLFGEPDRWRDHFFEFMERSRKSNGPGEFEAVFGVSTEIMDDLIRAYIKRRQFVWKDDASEAWYRGVVPEKDADGDPFNGTVKYTIVELPVREVQNDASVVKRIKDVGLAFGNAFRISGQYDQAMNWLLHARSSDKDVADIDRSLGFLGAASGEATVARHYLHQAIQGGMANLDVYAELVRLAVGESSDAGLLNERPDIVKIENALIDR